MALVESLSLELGQQMPTFTLWDSDNHPVNSEDYAGSRGLLVAFTCNHCPYARPIWNRLIDLAEYAQPLGVGTIAINPNIHPDYPDDSPPEMRKLIQNRQLQFPYLVDAGQEIARAYQAQCTPELYLLDSDFRLVYHGRFDDNWKDPDRVKHHDLQDAVDALIHGKPISTKQFHSMGCSIKWRDA
jgi:peroxiredoxin